MSTLSQAERAPVTDAPVLVTGAAGFVASQIVSDLLAAGYRVRGTVRSLAKTSGHTHLAALPGAAERLELVQADLLDAPSLVKAVAGCTHVVHAASPYVIDTKDPQRELVEPALQGTRHVLGACFGEKGVRRVVLTSSMAAVTDEPDGRLLTEADWNETSSLTRNPYYYSKTVAEREAWRLVEERKPAFDLVVLNPFLVVGPSLAPTLNTSNQVLLDLLTGKYPAIVALTWGFVDVRDVGRAHLLALESPRAKGRYLCSADTMSLRAVVNLFRRNGHERARLPRFSLDGRLGTVVARLASYLQPRGAGSYLRSHLGRVPRIDHAKIVNDLGLTFRPVESTLLETVADLIRWKHYTPPA